MNNLRRFVVVVALDRWGDRYNVKGCFMSLECAQAHAKVGEYIVVHAPEGNRVLEVLDNSKRFEDVCT